MTNQLDFTATKARAEKGESEAQYQLGFSYAKGEILKQDFAAAAQWLLRAANQGHARAQVYLGLLCSRGLGVPQNDQEAITWFRKAAEQTNSFAMLFLGLIYII